MKNVFILERVQRTATKFILPNSKLDYRDQLLSIILFILGVSNDNCGLMQSQSFCRQGLVLTTMFDDRTAFLRPRDV